MSDTSDHGAAEIVLLSDSASSQSLCYRCRRISIDTLFVRSGGFQHCNSLEDLIESAKNCDLCELFRSGLQKDISDKFPDEPLAVHKYIHVRPEVWQSSERDGTLQSGLRVRVADTDASCKLNWYLSDNETISSPARPEGYQKLLLAKAWLNKSRRDSQLSDTSTSPARRIRHALYKDQDFSIDFAPTRLLDLGLGTYERPDNIRLISYCDELPYIALSHRWGSLQHLTTTRANYLHHMLGIQFTALPKTFQDAITVARYLGIRYMWIDALCIVQDDKLDWHREATRMGNIYQDALCTIAIHGAHDDSTGFLERSLSPPPSVELSSRHRGPSCRVSLRSNFRADVDMSDLSKRGWVVQERFLSVRTLHFTDNAIFCEDSYGVLTEEDAYSNAKRKASSLLKAESNLLNSDGFGTPLESAQKLSHSTLSVSPDTQRHGFPSVPLAIGDGQLWNQNSDNSNPELLLQKHWPGSWHAYKSETIEPFNLSARGPAEWMVHGTNWDDGDFEVLWFELLERYSNTHLTYESDKLPAIAGLVKVFQRYTVDRYLSGVWAATLHIGLLWTACGTPLRRPRTERAPSWTWASMEGPIQHPEHLPLDSKIILLSDMPKYVSRESVLHSSLTISSKIKCLDFLDPAQEDDASDLLYGPVNLYDLYVTRKRQPIIWFTPENIKAEQQKRELPIPGPAGFAVLDEKSTTESQCSQIWCVEIATELAQMGAYSPGVWVLLVKRSATRPDCWCRVGVGFIRSGDGSVYWFDDVERTTITLV